MAGENATAHPRPAWRRGAGVTLHVVWRAFQHLLNDGGTMLAGHIAFATLFALFPFLIFLTALAGEIGQSEAAARFIEVSLQTLPEEIAQSIRPAIDEVVNQRRTGLMTVSILVSLWAVSSGLEALRYALNLAYGIGQERAIWKQRLQSLMLTVAFACCILLGMAFIVVAPLLWDLLAGIVKIPWFWAPIYTGARFGLTFIALFVMVCMLYQLLPNRRLAAIEILPGAAVTVVLWLIGASLFSMYLQNLGRFSITYGSLAGIIATLMFFYISALIFIFGAEINGARRRAEAERLRQERARKHGEAAG